MAAAVGPAKSSQALVTALPPLVSRVAHDLNNHLALILGKSELAIMLDDPERYRTGMGEICKAGQVARTLIADLQCVVAWALNGDEEERPAIADVLALSARLADRACRQHGIELKVDGAAGQVASPVAGTLALVCWRLLTRAVERRSASGDSAEVWTLSGSGPDPAEIVLTTPLPVWEVTERAEIARAVRSAEAQSGDASPVAADLVAFGAAVDFDGNRVRVVV